ncbi:hypothetical protein D8S78_24045 [Natrialba swarupiae]|nr:hypothetical protein [Natrialba swarupiae]
MSPVGRRCGVSLIGCRRSPVVAVECRSSLLIAGRSLSFVADRVLSLVVASVVSSWSSVGTVFSFAVRRPLVVGGTVSLSVLIDGAVRPRYWFRCSFVRRFSLVGQSS